ncbi:dual specificity protein kinase Ttk-like [Clavelina lepadiformis]|uniref:dual specificity protein kinase Ttk-like n=1 Tax=Clavelina lepadiformis TaxID=159417 RepID=UPI0040422714
MEGISNLTGDTGNIEIVDSLGNNPDQWLIIIRDCLNSHHNTNKNKVLKHLFFHAKKVLDVEENRSNESYAKILIHEAQFIGSASVGDARDAFRYAARRLQRIPIIHISHAQFELDQGRRDKAIKVLEFGKFLLPSNRDILSAMQKVNAGVTDLGLLNFLSNSSKPPLANITNIKSQQEKIHFASKSSHNAKNTPSSLMKRSHSDVAINTPPPTQHHHPACHSIQDVLDLPSSPCTPVLSTTPPSWLTTPQRSQPVQSRMNYSPFPINLKTPSPPRLTFSTSKSAFSNFTIPKLSPMVVSTSKGSNHSITKSNHSIGKPRRIPCRLPSSHSENDPEDEINGVEVLGDSMHEKVPHLLKPVNPPPGIRASVEKENIATMPPPNALPQRVPSQHSSEQEVQQWIKESKIMTIHDKTYLALKMLGEGGSSKVYEVVDVVSKSIKAIKQVFLRGCDHSVKEGFLNEIKFLEKLKQSPNIIHLYDYELTKDHLYIVMECGSTDLAKMLQRQRSQGVKLESYEIIYFWKKMLAAVKTIHEQGVIHLDLKPANFLLVKGNLKLIDFGIANSIQSDATSVIKDTQFGTLNYMAPEAILDMSGGYQSKAPKFKISPRSDVWSLGCILYSMMFGRTPFQHITHQLMKLSAITNPEFRIEFGDHSNKYLLQAVQSCLLRDPKRRPTVEQLLQCAY